jgi:pyruvate kinase
MPQQQTVENTESQTETFAGLIADVQALRATLVELPRRAAAVLEPVHATQRDSALNLLHYVALRGRDLRQLQMRLARAGLSSLGRAESHVLSAVDAVLDVLHRSGGPPPLSRESEPAPVDFEGGQRLLNQHTESLLGSVPGERGVAIMVTMPSDAANDYSLVQHLVEHGMDCMRINCAHDDQAAWQRMIDHLRRAERVTGRRCRIVMDLAGPKLRTGPVEPGPSVLKVRPQRDALGRVTQPARIWLSPADAPRTPPSPADASVELPAEFLASLGVGDRLHFTDARHSRRTLEVTAIGTVGCWAAAERTCYLTNDTRLRLERNTGTKGPSARVGGIPPLEGAITLRPGDMLVLTRAAAPGRNADVDRAGRVLNPAEIGCTLPEVFEDIRAGERIWIDDGRIGGVVERTESDRLLVRITHTRARGASLRADKGINLPESALRLRAMTDKDRADLSFVGQHADMVALSFANGVEDVRALCDALEPFGDRQPAIVLKIETRRGFENLPAMLLEAMKSPRFGVMIARGDLAVECGFERLAEVQEEILWICEAAHAPVIWATQVLESLAKTGLPSRAEITDAAMSHRAECVMLNKGPYVTEAVNVLDDILRRMHGHQAKKRAMLRELQLAAGFHAV